MGDERGADFQSGPPLSWGNVVYLGGPLDWNPHPQNPLTPGATIDTAEFYTASSLQPSDGIRTFDTYFNNLRRDPTKNADLSLLKKFQLREKMYLQLDSKASILPTGSVSTRRYL